MRWSCSQSRVCVSDCCGGSLVGAARVHHESDVCENAAAITKFVATTPEVCISLNLVDGRESEVGDRSFQVDTGLTVGDE